MTVHTGRHFLQIPGPTNVPDRVLRAMDMPTMDHRGPEFAEIGHAVLAAMQRVFRTKQPVIIYPSSGTGAWEAALVNTLNSGDTVLMWETGHFASLWKKMADKLGIKSEFMGGDWRKPADPAAIKVMQDLIDDGFRWFISLVETRRGIKVADLLQDWHLFVEEWTTWDTFGMLVQLGAMPEPARA